MTKRKKIILYVILAIITSLAMGIAYFEIFKTCGNCGKPAVKNLTAIDVQQNSDADVSAENKSISTETPKKTDAIPPKTDPKKSDGKITDKLVNFGFEAASGRLIDTIIIHSSYDALGNNPYGVSSIIEEYKSYGVSPHYLIDRAGNVYRLVKEKDVAYHAGVGKTPDGRKNVNDFSIGIEIMETKTDNPSPEQYASLKSLLARLKKEHEIKYVLGHYQISFGRKTDPWNFDWDKIK